MKLDYSVKTAFIPAAVENPFHLPIKVN